MSTLNQQLNTYYSDQLAKLGNPNAAYQTQIKLSNMNGETNYLSLNNESAPVLASWLNDNYNTGKPIESNTQRVFQIVKLGFAKRQWFCNLADIPGILKNELEKNDAFKIYHFWDTERKACSKKYINDMFYVNEIDFKIKQS